MAAVTIDTYRPEYNPEKKQYEDKNPIPPYKQGFRYRCLCSHSTNVFTKSSDFTQHFKNKTHKLYVLNYEINIKDITDANDRIIELQKSLEKKYNETQRLLREVNTLNLKHINDAKEIEELKKKIEYIKNPNQNSYDVLDLD